MQGPDLLFHLTDENYNFYQPDKDGLMVVSSAPYFFKFSPDGWYNIEVKNIRNKNYWAVDRSVSIPLAYLGDAGKLLKTIVLTRGTEQVKAYLTICSQQLHYTPGVEYSYYYKKEFRGAIDLSSYNHEGVKVTFTTQEDGLPKYLKANEGNTLELPMNVPEAVYVKMDGVNLRNKVNYTVIELAEGGGGVSGFKNLATIPLTISSQGGDSYGLVYLTTYPEQIDNDSNAVNSWMPGSQNWCIFNDGAIPITFPLNGRIDLECVFNPELSRGALNLYFIKSDQTVYTITTGQVLVAGQSYSYPFTFSITLNPGEKLFPMRNIDDVSGFFTNSGLTIVYKETSFCIAEPITKKPATYIPHLTGQYIFEKLIAFVTDNEYTAALSAFLNLNRNVLFTCGDAIRNLKDSNGNPSAIMKITLKKFFKFWDCFYSVGLIPIESTRQVNIDEKINLADRTKVIRLDSPETPPKVFLRKDLMWNVLKIGYPEIKNEVGVLNGNEAFCCGYEWRINATSSPAEINKISEIRADCYEQEIIRITLTDKDTTDSKRDNEIYANYVTGVLQPAGTDYPAHYLLDRSLNATATGLLEKDTIWNLRLSPKRMLLNNGGFLRSSMLHCDGLDITYSTADKNNRVSAGGVTEKDNVPLGSAGTKFFYPVGISMQLPSPSNILDLLNTSPLSTIEVEIGGTVYTGIMEKSSIYLSGSRVAEHEILLDERNDLTKLIDYDG